MAGEVHAVMRLLLLFFVCTGVNADNTLMTTERGYDIIFPCEEDFVCFHLWQISTGKASEYIAIVSNGEIQAGESEELECSLQIKSLTAEDVGRHRCQQRPDVHSPHNTHLAAPVLNLMPAKTVTLQCVFLTYVEQGLCYTQPSQMISLTWVDETGAEIQDNTKHQISVRSPCDITLTVTVQRPKSKKFRCQATVDEKVQTSVEFRISVPALTGKGKRIIIEVEPEQQGGNQDAVGAAVGAVSCVALTAGVAVFVVNRRRTSRLLTEPCSVQSTPNNVMNTDDVIYADVILPVDSDCVRVHNGESTEYACIRYK